MKTPNRPISPFLRKLLTCCAALPLIASQVQAANSTWTGATSGNFSDASNWTNGVPGVSALNFNGDVATFNNGANTTITLDAPRVLGNFTFDTGAGAYRFFGSPVQLTGGNDFNLTAGVTNSQSFFFDVSLWTNNGGLAFLNASTTAGVIFNVHGNLAGRNNAGAGAPVQFSGTGTGAIIWGQIANNGSAPTALSKDFNGTFLLLKNTNSSFSGQTAVARGSILFDSIATIGGGNSSMGAAANSTNGTLALGSTTSSDVVLYYTGQGSTTDRNITLSTGSGVNLSALGSGALVWNGNIGSSANATRTITLSGISSAENRFGGVISNSTNAGEATALVKAGSGVWNLSGANTNTGNITVLDGLLRLDFAAASAPSSNILSASSPLAMRGGTLAVRGKASGSTSQTFNGLSLTSGQSKILVDGNGGTGTTLNVGNISRSGAGTVLDVSLASTGAFQTSYTTTTNGVLSSGDVAFATVNGSDWATVSGGNVVALASYQTSNNPADWGATDNVSLTGAVSQNAGNQTINTLRMAQGASLSIGGTNVTTIGAGGVLFTGTANNLITGGTLRGSGGATRELIVIQNQTGGTAEIASNIANNTSATAFTKAGAGTLTLSGNNTFTGSLTIANGVLRIASAGSYQNQYLVLSGGVLGLGAGNYTGDVQASAAAGRVAFTNSGGFAAYGSDRSVTLTGNLIWGSTTGFLGQNDALILGAADADAKVTLTSAMSLSNTGSQAYLREIRVNNGSAAVDAEISGVLSTTTAATNHAGIIKTGTGTLTLSATNTYDGPTIINAGTLMVTGSIANSMLTTVESGATLAGNGTTAQIEVKAGGSIRPGNGGIGTLSTSQNGNSDFNWNGETSGTFAQMKFELSNVDATSDRLNLGSGLLLKAGGSVFRFDFLNTGLVNTTYTLISFGQSVGFNVSDFGYENLAQGLTGQFNLTPTSLTFTTAVVPEPLVIAPIMIGFLGLLVLHRRSRRKQQMI